MKLYLIRGNDTDGENQDLFVVAHDASNAIDVWNDYLVENGWPRDNGDHDESLPRTQTFDPANVRQILPDVTGTIYEAKGTKFAGVPRGIDWASLTEVWTA